MVASPLNLIASVSLLALLSTGLLIWARRKLRRPRARRQAQLDAAALNTAT